MDRVILQVPMPKSLKTAAETVARDFGFSSLQETIRVILTKLAKRELTVTVKEEKVIQLSAKAEKRYAKMIDDIEKGRNIVYTKNADDFLKKLRS